MKRNSVNASIVILFIILLVAIVLVSSLKPLRINAATNIPQTELTGKKILNFGDSIVGSTEGAGSISAFLAEKSGATVYNVGFGGARMSTHTGTVAAFSMHALADAITSKNFSVQNYALANNPKNVNRYLYQLHLNRIKNLNFSKIDFITIAYGTNDYTAAKELDNPDNPEDVTTYKGALRYTLRKFYEAYPNLKILVVSPMYRVWHNPDGSFLIDSDKKTYNLANNTLPDFVKATKEVCQEYKTPFVDQYNSLGINQVNRLSFYTVADGTHPNESGRKKVALKWYRELINNF